MKTIKTTMTFFAVALFFAFGTAAMANDFDDPNFNNQDLSVQNLDQGLGSCQANNSKGDIESDGTSPQLTFDIWDFLGAFSTI